MAVEIGQDVLKIIREVKRHINKDDEVYECQLLHRDEGYLVLLFVNDTAGNIGDVFFDAGSRTVAHYWVDRGYVLWRMYESSGDLKGHSFHICGDVKINEDYVSYLDLLLDVWFYPDGSYLILDEDEVDDCKRRGLIDDRALEWIEKQKALITDKFEKIVNDIWMN